MARDFDGVDDRIVVGNTNIVDTGSFTTIGLVRVDTISAQQSLLTRSSTTEVGWRCDVQKGTNIIGLTKQGVADVDSTLSLTAGVWYVLAFRHIVTTSVVFYRKRLDSLTIDSETVLNTSAILSSGNGTVIGNRVGDEAVAIDGAIAAVWHYNVDLGDALVSTILGSNGMYVHPANLQLHMHLFGLAAETDWSGNNNHSTSIVGTTVIDHPPGIGAIWLAPHPRLVQVAAAAADNPIYQPWYQLAPLIAQ